MKHLTLSEINDIAKVLYDGGIVPRGASRPGDLAARILAGQEVGLPPVASCKAIAVINGSAVIWGDAALALVLKSGLCGKFKEWVTEDGSAAYCQSWRDGSEYTQYFTMQEAEKAGLTSKKGPWQEYPRRQLQMRARSWHLRDTYPDVLCGLGIAEEAIDYARAQQEQKLQQQESQATSVVHTSNTKYQNDIAVVQWKDATTTTTAPTSFGQQPHQDEKPDTEIRSLIIDRIHDAVPVLCRAWGIKYSADGTTTPEFYERWHDLTGGVIMDEMTDEQLQTLYEIVIETKNEQEVKELLGDESKA